MKNKHMMVAMCLIGILALVGLASSQQAGDLPQGVTPTNDCLNVTWEESFPIVEACTEPMMTVVCSDEPTNTSCAEQETTKNYPCITGTRVEQKSRLDCTTEAYTINNEVKLNIEGYACKADLEGTTYTVICDSKYDGNGDGICSPGETCQKFIVTGDQIQQYEKNSQNEFTESDDSFVFDRATAEVLP